MKKILLTFALAIAMSVPASATTIGDWLVQSGTEQYKGTQASTATNGLSANGIVYSRHNLSSYGEHYQVAVSDGPAGNAAGVATTEVCVFCHTPHFGRVDTAPLWNRGTSATGYVTYGTTIGGTDLNSNTVGGSSLACLSCHDGVTTLDNIINKPGKGSGVKGGSPSANADAGWVFTEIEPNETIAGGVASRLNIGAGPDDVRDPNAVNLSNDHPIDVTYNAGNVASLRPTTTKMSDLTMDNARSYADAAGNTDAGTYGRSDNLWASRGFISNTVTIGEILRDTGKVQCASCHDPHYKNQTNTDPAVVKASSGPDGGKIKSVENDGLFLRRVGGNSNSGVCRTCHAK